MEYLKQNAVIALILVVGALFTGLFILEQEPSIVGRAFHQTIDISGKVAPNLPDGVNIYFKVGELVVAEGKLKNNTYGVEEKIFLIIDDTNTPEKEGYLDGDTITFYIEDIKIAEISYLREMPRTLEIPASKRAIVSNRVAELMYCLPDWKCTEWTKCTNDRQTRNCMDKKDCTIELAKPNEEKSCRSPTEETPYQQEESLLLEYLIIFGIGILIILGIVAVFVKLTRKAKAKKLEKRVVKKTSKKKAKKKKK